MQGQRFENIPVAARSVFETIIGFIDAFCLQHLNKEYAVLCRKLAVALARKRPSPLMRGDLQIWACAIVYSVGSVNFLFDRTHNPSMSMQALCKVFGVSCSSGASKAKLIRDMFHITISDPHWCLPSQMEHNPAIWMLEVNGIIVDIREMPLDMQLAAHQRGLIPYVPADRPLRNSDNSGDKNSGGEILNPKI